MSLNPRFDGAFLNSYLHPRPSHGFGLNPRFDGAFLNYIRLEMYDNGNENNRAKIFESNTERNEDFVILDGRLIAQPYYAQSADGSIFQAVRFHVEINQYLNIGMVGNRAQTPDVTDIEGISDAIIVEDFEVPEIEAKVPEAAEPVRQPRGKKAAQETKTESAEQAQQSIDELLEGAEAI